MATPQPCPPPTPAAPPLLSLDAVSVHFGRRLALGDVTLRFAAGESVAIVGPNGAGKSTMLRVMAGMLAPSHGRVTRHDMASGSRPLISYVPQRSGVDWSFPVDVLDVVLMGLPASGPLGRLLPYRRDARDRALVALDRVGMRDYARTQIGELSGGQQQRVFLARALVQEGDVLLLDEPFTGVDVPTQDVLLDVLAGQCRSGRTVIYATHDLGQARQAATRVLLVNGGVIADGPPRSVLTTEALRATFGGQAIILAPDDLAPDPGPVAVAR